MTNTKKTHSLLVIVPLLLVAAILFAITTRQTSLQGGLQIAPEQNCAPFSPAQMIEQMNPSAILTLWQNEFGVGIVQSHCLSLLIMLIVFAITYRCTADLFGVQQAAWSILIAALIAAPLAFMGWTVPDAITCLLIGVSILLLWKVVKHPSNLLVVLIYTEILILLAQWLLLWLVVLFHGLYVCFGARKRKSVVAGAIFFYATLLFLYSKIVNTAQNVVPINTVPWYDFYVKFKPQLPALTVAICLAATILFIAWYRDRRSREVSVVLLLPIILIPLLLSPLFGNKSLLLMLASITVPLAMLLSFGLGMAQLRIKVFAVCIVLAFILIPRQFEDAKAVQNLIVSKHTPGMALVVYPSFNYAMFMKQAQLVNQFCASDEANSDNYPAIYYRNDIYSLIVRRPAAIPAQTPIWDLGNLRGLILIWDDQNINALLPQLQLISTDKVNDINISVYQTALP